MWIYMFIPMGHLPSILILSICAYDDNFITLVLTEDTFKTYFHIITASFKDAVFLLGSNFETYIKFLDK